MFALFKKEFNSFFASPIGYLVVGLFLLTNSLLLWYFKGNWNIFNTGFADMQAFFDSTPWLFILLIPAITMRTFSDEYSNATIEILKTKPLSHWQIVGGKFLSSLALIGISLLPTLIYALSIAKLAKPERIDWSTIIGSYLGLIFLGAAFTAIGLFASVLSKNQIVVFIIGLIISFTLYFGIQQLVIWNPNLPDFIQKLSLYEHYKSMGKGVIDSSSLIYLSSVSIAFLYMTKLKLDS